MIPTINPPTVRTHGDAQYTREDLNLKRDSELKSLHNMVWDVCEAEGLPKGDMKRRRKWVNHEEAVETTWTILGVYNGDITMSEKTPDPRPTPKCYSAELVKRPTRKMFMRIKKVGEPDKSQRPFAWPQFENGMRLIDIKEDPNLHAGKITFWMRQEPPLIELEDISDEQFQKELDEWYEKHGLQNPEAQKRAKAEERAKAKAEREAAREAKAKEREAAKAEREKAKAEKAAEREKAKAEKAKAKAEAPKAKAAPAKKAAPAAKAG